MTHAPAPGVGNASRALVAALVVALAVVLAPVAHADGTTYASDEFSRSASGGWQFADRGGHWYHYGPRSGFAVADGAGTAQLTAGGGGRASVLASVNPTNVVVAARMRTEKQATGYGQYLSVMARTRDWSTQYRGRLRIAADGGLHVGVTKVVGSPQERLVGEERAVGIRSGPGTPVEVRLQVEGTNPTRLRMKAWPADAAEPDVWAVDVTDAEPALQQRGVVGVRADVSPSATNLPVGVEVERFSAFRVPATPDAPAPNPGPAPAPPAGPGTTDADGIVPTRYPVPSGARFVAPDGDDRGPGSQSRPWRTVGHAVKAAPAGATIVLRTGVYREQVSWHGKRLALQPYPGETVWFDGSDVVTDWRQDGSAWRHDNWRSGFRQGGVHSDFLDADKPLAAHPEMVFVDGRALEQVGSRDEVGPGTFYVDPRAAVLFIGDSPVGRRVEVSTRSQALYVNKAHGTVVRGLGFRRYGTHMHEHGAVKGDADRLVFEDLTFSQNASAGLYVLGRDAVVARSVFVENGQIGLSAHRAHDLVVRDSRFLRNNTEGFRFYGAQGGLKATESNRITLEDNLVEGNFGRGLWMDISSNDATVVGNVVRDNLERGIQFEISHGAVIASNLVVGNGTIGIYALESSDVDVYNNTLVDNAQGIRVFEGQRRNPHGFPSWDVADVTIRNNVISGSRDGKTTLFGVDHLDKSLTGEQMGVSANYDVFHRASAQSPKWVIQWSQWPRRILMATSVGGFHGETGRESRAIELVGDDVPLFRDRQRGDYRLADGSPARGSGEPLPEHIARAIGVPQGRPVDRGVLSW